MFTRNHIRFHEIAWILLISLIANEFVSLRSDINFDFDIDVPRLLLMIALILSFTSYTFLFFGLKICDERALTQSKIPENSERNIHELFSKEIKKYKGLKIFSLKILFFIALFFLILYIIIGPALEFIL